MGKVYASSDWHGSEIGFKVLNFLKSDDILYFIGDVVDRGTRGIELLDILMNRPNTYFIKGNHEDMMSFCLPYIIKDLQEIDCIEPEKYSNNNWFLNGGWQTIEGGLIDKPIEKLYQYKEFIDNLPTELKYKSPKGHTIILEHAGYTPFDIPHRSHDPLWDREHFYDRWDNGWGYEEKSKVGTTYLVHGHTPVQYLEFYYGYEGQPQKTKEMIKCGSQWNKSGNCDWIPEIIRYCDGHKIDLDLCTIVSNRIALLDLDTFEVIYFDAN